MKDSNPKVRHAFERLFEIFDQEGSAEATAKRMKAEGLSIPTIAKTLRKKRPSARSEGGEV